MATPPEENIASINTNFEVSTEAFSGPFSLLLSLVAKHELDITEVSLAQVTDEFIAFLANTPDLAQASEFIVVAATLLDIKAALLLPRQEVEEEPDWEYLEARDLLFSRLLQYRAFKAAAAALAAHLHKNQAMHPRAVSLEPHFVALLPELVMMISPSDLAAKAGEALSHRPVGVQTLHLHDPVVPVRQQAQVLVKRLRQIKVSSFRELIEDATSRAVVVSRFLALLQLFGQELVNFEQGEALTELLVRWVGPAEGVELDADFEEFEFTEG